MQRGYERCVYDFRILTIDEALGSITCWDTISSVASYASSPEGVDKAKRYIDDFPPGPVIVVAYELSTLGRIWPDMFGGRSGTELVICDGNHRLAALSLRRAKGLQDDRMIGAFVGR